MDPINYSIQTFGCKVNTYDTGLLQKRLAASGFEQSELPQVHILNTCAVTAEATREAGRVARRLKRKNPNSLVVMTGCSAQVDTEILAELKEADLIVANSHKGDLESLIAQKLQGQPVDRIHKSNIFKKIETEPGGGIESQHSRTFLKIQDGCNSFCTFCVIPFARGKSRSISIENLVNRTNELYDQGFREVVLTGVHIGDYEDPQGPGQKIEKLVKALLTQTKIPRFRLSSLEPIELSDELFEIYKDERMCPHFHMSIQSANSKVLRDMKRQYGQDEVIGALERIGRELPQAFVGMDVIAGFVGETDNEFNDTLKCLTELPWTRMHVFPYSVRPKTYAAHLPNDVPETIIRKRALQLRELSSERFAQKALEQVGQRKKVLPLKKSILKSNKNSEFRGLSRDYWPISLSQFSQPDVHGEIEVFIKGYDHSLSSRMDGHLVGEILWT